MMCLQMKTFLPYCVVTARCRRILMLCCLSRHSKCYDRTSATPHVEAVDLTGEHDDGKKKTGGKMNNKIKTVGSLDSTAAQTLSFLLLRL